MYLYTVLSLYIYMYRFHIPKHMYTCNERIKLEYVSRYTSQRTINDYNKLVDTYVKMHFILVQGSTKTNSSISFRICKIRFSINFGQESAYRRIQVLIFIFLTSDKLCYYNDENITKTILQPTILPPCENTRLTASLRAVL